MARETWVQSQVESYQRLKKWYLMPPCLTLIIRYGSRIKWSNQGKGVEPSPTLWCSSYRKREPSGHPRLWSTTMVLCLIIGLACWNAGIEYIERHTQITCAYISIHISTHLSQKCSHVHICRVVYPHALMLIYTFTYAQRCIRIYKSWIATEYTDCISVEE